jgi:hypothetical protein
MALIKPSWVYKGLTTFSPIDLSTSNHTQTIVRMFWSPMFMCQQSKAPIKWQYNFTNVWSKVHLWVNSIVLAWLKVCFRMNLWIFGFMSGWTTPWLTKAIVNFCIVLWHDSHKLLWVFVWCQDTIDESHYSFYKQWVAFLIQHNSI